MNPEFDDIKSSIKEIALNGELLHSMLCFVHEVDETNLSCSVYSADGLSVYRKVRLKEITTTDNKESGVWMVPVKGSRVIIDFIGNDQPYITMVSEVEKTVLLIEGVRTTVSAKGISVSEDETINFNITPKGVSLENIKENIDLKKTLDEFLDFMKTEFIVQTAWGPSGPALSNVGTRIDQFKSDFAKVFMEGGENGIE